MTLHKMRVLENKPTPDTRLLQFRDMVLLGARCSSVVRAFAHGAMDCQIDPSW